ncbi:hypothetical protein [Amycolatopsis cihanbeyliensis]|uniref:Uncharacterized protein n=1 Tax=Amycolatopsis cihanbeyliensis TaxID=1128664 RepID=A0A542DES2_AMYCI|nr:hypothetical protein [Amycolatopsis cihanbeyliensis]TQJ01578.1 hypothetical protein FB471_1269 [Amycolatopsis cihanbeyliensis]
MTQRKTALPLIRLLARLGWQPDADAWTIRCRDGHGKRARLRVQLATTGVAVVPSAPGPWCLGPLEGGRLRRVLAEAFLSYGHLAGTEPRDLTPRAHHGPRAAVTRRRAPRPQEPPEPQDPSSPAASTRRPAEETTATASTTKPSDRPAAAPRWLRDLAHARVEYQDQLGWPVHLEVRQRRLVTQTGTAFDALTMPFDLAEETRRDLEIAMLVGPILTGPGRRWWTFLTKPAPSRRLHVPADLHQLRVRPIPRGTHVVLPFHIDVPGPESWRWIESPMLRRTLPPWSTVVAVARRVANRRSVELAPPTRPQVT